MIKLSKRIIPEEIQQRIADRTRRFLALSATGEVVPDSLASAYRNPEIKALLKEETHGKCAYCESKVPHVDYGDVEHIISKSRRPDLRFDYSNLTFACGVCNTKKGDYHSDELPLLNPYVDEPADHLRAYGPVIMRLPSSDRGLVTEKRLDLNRGELVERRTERLEQIQLLVDQWIRTRIPEIRAVLEDQIREECKAEREYVLAVTSFIGALDLPDPIAIE